MSQIRVPINRPIMDKAERDAVLKVLDSGMLTGAQRDGGMMVQAFESAICDYTGAAHAVAVSSGTSALQAAFTALDVGPGDDVVIPSFTHVSTANAVIAVGARPVFADIGTHYNMTAETLKAAMTERTACVVPVHLYGHAVDITHIREIAGNIPILEDAAQALGTTLHGRHAGTAGDAGIYSFYPGKVVTAGEGGMVVTNDSDMYNRLLDIRNHGSAATHGTNLRLPEISAAIGSVQMRKLAGFLERRRANALMLHDVLDGVVPVPAERYGERRNWNLYTISSPRRDRLLAVLHGADIGAAIYYGEPVHTLERFAGAALPNTEECARTVLSLPVHPAVTAHDIHTMAAAIRQVCSTA